MKPDTFDFKSLPTFPATQLSSHACKKPSKNSLCLEEVHNHEIKPDRNVTHLNPS